MGRECIYCGGVRPRTPVSGGWAHRACIITRNRGGIVAPKESEVWIPGPGQTAKEVMEPRHAPDQKPTISASSLQMLFRCGEQYRRRYIEGEKIAPAVPMLIGRGVDESVNQNMETKIQTGQLLEEERVKEIARDTMVREWESGEVLFSDEERETGPAKVKGAAIDEAVGLADLHHIELAPIVQPETVQEWWRIDLEHFPFDLVGLMDIEEVTNVVRDVKTSGKSPTEDEADRSIQLSFYALKRRVINGMYPDKLTLDYLVRTKTPKAVVRETTRGDDAIESLLHRVEVAAESIQRGIFNPANETEWMCSPKWCGYFDSCKYVRGGRKRPKS